jgi:DNA-binding NarL/FixJ family response regulator
MAHSTNLPHQDRVRILAIDSTSMSTQLLVDALARNTQFHVIEAPTNESEVLPLVKAENPDVALLSAKLGMGGHVAFDLVRNLRAEQPSLRVVMLLDHSDPASVVEAFRAGAHGIFCRTQPLRLLTKCIECVHAGQVWANSSELHFLLEALAKPTLASFRHLGSSPLSARESDVVRCVAEGMTNRDIARRLKLTEHTVKNYLFRIFDKLGVSSRVEVVLYALGNGQPRPPVSQNGRRAQAIAARKSMEPIQLPVRKNDDMD